MIANRVPEIDGVRITQIKSVSDTRGTFIKFHPLQEFEDTLDSVALSFNPNPGTIRGLHFQVEPFAEEKLVACVQGSIFDVIVDLRPSSRTFGKWTSFELSAANVLQVYLPKGIAHGFQTLVPDSIIHYSLGASYSPESSYSIDPFGDLAIDWPLKDLSISEKDAQGESLSFAAQKYAESLKG
jgi:dTDP-4-dehydrorhamnose 3,5-epimerase